MFVIFEYGRLGNKKKKFVLISKDVKIWLWNGDGKYISYVVM